MVRIQGIGAGTGTSDELSIFDKDFDGSIGGLGTVVEKMHNTERSVPLFEFRDLIGSYNVGVRRLFEQGGQSYSRSSQNIHQSHLKEQNGLNSKLLSLTTALFMSRRKAHLNCVLDVKRPQQPKYAF